MEGECSNTHKKATGLAHIYGELIIWPQRPRDIGTAGKTREELIIDRQTET
jgi:hypothetical protein